METSVPAASIAAFENCPMNRNGQGGLTVLLQISEYSNLFEF
jgi:hypothetical protein